MRIRPLAILALLMLVSCSPRARHAVSAGTVPDIFPDYVGVTVPATVAPLDFAL